MPPRTPFFRGSAPGISVGAFDFVLGPFCATGVNHSGGREIENLDFFERKSASRNPRTASHFEVHDFGFGFFSWACLGPGSSVSSLYRMA